MYDNGIIDMNELKEKTSELAATIDRLTEEIELRERNISKGDLLKNALSETFKDIDSILQSGVITNAMLTRLIEKIEVDENGNIDIYLKLLSDIGLDSKVLLYDTQT